MEDQREQATKPCYKIIERKTEEFNINYEEDINIFFFKDLVFVYKYKPYPKFAYIDVLSPELKLIKKIEFTAHPNILKEGTTNEDPDRNTDDEDQFMEVPIHVGFNRFNEFLALDSWSSHIQSKAQLNEPQTLKQLGLDLSKERASPSFDDMERYRTQMPKYILLSKGLSYSILDVERLQVYPVVNCNSQETFDPHLRHIQGFSLFRRYKGKLHYFDIEEFIKTLESKKASAENGNGLDGEKMLKKRNPLSGKKELG